MNHALIARHQRTGRPQRLMHFMMGLAGFLFVFCSQLEAQQLHIVPRTPVGPDLIGGFPEFLCFDATVDVNGGLELQAFLETEFAIIDATELCTWSITTDGYFAWNSAHRSLLLPRGSSAIVRVTYGGLEFSMRVLGAIHSDLDAMGAAITSDRSTVPTQQQLKTGILSIIDQLDILGVPVDAWRTAANNTRVRDDRNAFEWLFGKIRVTKEQSAPGVNDAVTGLYVPAGIVPVQNVQTGWWRVTILFSDVIVLLPRLSDQIANPQSNDPLFPLGEGVPRVAEWGTLPLHEMLHKIIFEGGFRKDFPGPTPEDRENQEETLVRDLAERALKFSVSILQIISMPELTTAEHQVIRQTVIGLRILVNALRRDFEAEAPGLVDHILDALGWSDADGDGLPDWLEQKLRDAGLDPDQPSWFPHIGPPGGGGGGNPEPIDEEPPPMPGEGPLTDQPPPTIGPGDPNG